MSGLSSGERQVVKDIYFSFRYSQGNIDMQKEDLLPLVRDYYTAERPELAAILSPPNYQKLGDALCAMTIPRAHAKMTAVPDYSSEDLTAQREIPITPSSTENAYHAALRIAGSSKPTSRSNVIRAMLSSDIEYAKNGRPMRGPQDSTRFDSILREYVLLGNKQPGSETYRAIFASLRTELIYSSIRYDEGLSTLAEKWEQRHGQKFFGEQGPYASEPFYTAEIGQRTVDLYFERQQKEEEMARASYDAWLADAPEFP
jgi:hypothetical protein